MAKVAWVGFLPDAYRAGAKELANDSYRKGLYCDE